VVGKHWGYQFDRPENALISIRGVYSVFYVYFTNNNILSIYLKQLRSLGYTTV
jgi:hypothetical protein